MASTHHNLSDAVAREAQSLVKLYGFSVSDVAPEFLSELPALIMLRRLQLLGWVGYQQQRLAFARGIGPRYTKDSCRLAEDFLTRFA